MRFHPSPMTGPTHTPYAVARPDEVYVPWGRPADMGPVPGIQADALTTARAALALMVDRVTFDADIRFGSILWEATARLRRLEDKITMGMRPSLVVPSWMLPGHEVPQWVTADVVHKEMERLHVLAHR